MTRRLGSIGGFGAAAILFLSACGSDDAQSTVSTQAAAKTTEPAINTSGSTTTLPSPSTTGGFVEPGGDGVGGIVFSRPVDGGGSQQFTVNADGSDERLVEVPDQNEDFGRATWSPDGDQLLFSNVFRFDEGGEITRFRPAVARADGTDFRVLASTSQWTCAHCVEPRQRSRSLRGRQWGDVELRRRRRRRLRPAHDQHAPDCRERHLQWATPDGSTIKFLPLQSR